MKISTLTFAWTVPMWYVMFFVGLVFAFGMAVDPYVTWSDETIITTVARFLSPFFAAWVFGLVVIGFRSRDIVSVFRGLIYAFVTVCSLILFTFVILISS